MEEEEGEEEKEEKKEEEKEIRTRMQSFAAMQHSLLMGLGYRVYANISDDASDSIENDMGSRHKSWEWLVWSP